MLGSAGLGRRSRWVAAGAAVVLLVGGGGLLTASASASAPGSSSFVPITPCRLFDTRPESQVGDRGVALGAGETLDRAVWGANGNCAIPNTATAITYNLTVPDGRSGYLTVYPGDASLPKASSINPVTGEGVKANGGVVALSATGAIKVFSLTGPVNALLDVTGYYVAEGTAGGTPGPEGPPGPAGPAGQARAYGHLSMADVLSKAKNVVSVTHVSLGLHCIEFDASVPAASAVATVTMDYNDDLSTVARMQYTEVFGTCGANGIAFVTQLYTFGQLTSTFADGAFYFNVA